MMTPICWLGAMLYLGTMAGTSARPKAVAIAAPVCVWQNRPHIELTATARIGHGAPSPAGAQQTFPGVPAQTPHKNIPEEDPG